MSPKLVSEKANVAFFDENFVESGLVEEAGFYVVEKEAFENVVVPHTPDGQPIPNAQPVSLGPKIGKRVYPDDRPIEMDESGVPVNEREAGWYDEPFSQGGDE